MIIPSTGRHILSSDGPKHSWKLAQGLLSWHRTEIVKNGKLEMHYTILLLNLRSRKYIFMYLPTSLQKQQCSRGLNPFNCGHSLDPISSSVLKHIQGSRS